MKKLLFIIGLVLVIFLSYFVLSQDQSTGRFTIGNEPPYVGASSFEIQDGATSWDNTGIDTHDSSPQFRWIVEDPNPDSLISSICIGTSVSACDILPLTVVGTNNPGETATYDYLLDLTLAQIDCVGVECRRTYYVDIVLDDGPDPDITTSFTFDLINQVPDTPSTLVVSHVSDPAIYVSDLETHNQLPDLNWVSTDSDTGGVDRWPADTLTYYAQVGEVAPGDINYLDATEISASSTITSAIPWGPENTGDTGESLKTVQVRIWTEDNAGIVSSNYDTTFDLIDQLPSLVTNGIYLSDLAINELTDSCTEFLPTNCFFSPAQGDYAAVNIQLKVDDLDGDDCSVVSDFSADAVLCLVDAAGIEFCDTVTNADYAYSLTFLGQSTTECDFSVAIAEGNTAGIEFFQLPGIYKLYVNASSQSEITSSTWGYNYEWEYGENYAVNYPASVNLGDASIELGSWNPGNTLYTMINQGNIILNLEWQATDPALTTYTCSGPAPECCATNDPTGCWDLTTTSDLQVDDDLDQIDDTGNEIVVNIPEEQVIPAGINFEPSGTGLELCDVMTCDSLLLSETFDTAFHIRPPVGLPTGDYETTITIDLVQRP